MFVCVGGEVGRRGARLEFINSAIPSLPDSEELLLGKPLLCEPYPFEGLPDAED